MKKEKIEKDKKNLLNKFFNMFQSLLKTQEELSPQDIVEAVSEMIDKNWEEKIEMGHNFAKSHALHLQLFCNCEDRSEVVSTLNSISGIDMAIIKDIVHTNKNLNIEEKFIFTAYFTIKDPVIKRLSELDLSSNFCWN